MGGENVAYCLHVPIALQAEAINKGLTCGSRF